MKKYILALMLAVLPASFALAKDNVLTWIPPTTYENGLELPSTEIKNYRIEWTLDGVGQPDLLADGGTTASFAHKILYRGVYCYTVYTIATNDLESNASNTACKTVEAGKPNPPTALGVN